MKKLAIVGSGISAMSCAHYLKGKYKISIFDKNDYLGGHTHTHRMEEDGNRFTLDTGFIVFNHETYPNLLNLFRELGIKGRKSDMSFAVCNHDNGLQYGSAAIFAQRSRMISLGYWRFLNDINRFFRIAKDDNKMSGMTIRQYCRKNRLSGYFMDNYLVPMSSAVWSMPHKEVYDFPIALLIPFFKNHGLIGIRRHLQWYTVKGGSDSYTGKIVEGSGFDIHLKEPVVSAEETKGKVALKTRKRSYTFDHVILASHADESLRIAKGLPEEKRKMLQAFSYTPNAAVLHTDSSIMPSIRGVWSSWNHMMSKGQTSTIYWLNRLQNPGLKKDYFLSINPFQDIAGDKIIKRIKYSHPSYSMENFALQKKLQDLNKDTRIFFAGAYFGYGFHEDGIKSGLEVVRLLR